MEKYRLVKFSSNRSLEEAEEMYNQRIEDAIDIYKRYNGRFFLRECPFCGSGDYTDSEKFHNTYGISKCNKCNSLYVNPCPDIEALDDYYKNSKCNMLLDRLYKKRHAKSDNYIMDDRVKEVLKHISENPAGNLKVFEIGCGSGSFLSKLNQAIKKELPDKNVELYGIDVDRNAIENNVDNELNLICSNAEEFTKKHTGNYDIIVHFELIEHLTDPFTFMKNLYRILKPDGLMIFTTPNSAGLEEISSDYNSYRLIAPSIFPPLHLNAFNTFNITHFAIRSNYKVLQIKTPGKLDMDMMSLTRDYLKDEGLKMIADFDDETRGLIQHLISTVNASSHMMCILRK
ncbi:class I SAM-dependent methyltransferase [Syntrophomonas curvata]